MTIGKKMAMGFAVVLLLTVAISVIAFFGMNKMVANRNVLSERTSDAALAAKIPFWVIKQYQNQADLIINKDLEIVKDFQAAAQQMDMLSSQVGEKIDTPEEKAWFAKLQESDSKFDEMFHKMVVPEVEHQLKNYIG